MAAIYVHLPFCPYICPYCDFAKWPHKRSAAAEYLTALFAEIASRNVRSDYYETLFLGGGTPNTYEPQDIAQLLERLRARFRGPANRETTIEVNPELVTLDALRVYREAGINRLSVGVQSFVAEEIRTLGRRHTPEQVAQVVEWARAAGIPAVSLDLIFAVPGQTPQTWRRSLETAVALGVDHVSAYGLTVEAGTPYEGWQEREPGAFLTDSDEADLYAIAIDTLEAAGFEHYEISNFAKPGYQSAHNANYWANGEYAGLGVGAASYEGGVRSIHTKELRAYVSAALKGEAIPSESEHLEGPQAAGEAVMLALRTAQGVSLQEFKERYGVDFLTFYEPVVRRYCEDGLLEVDALHARLTRRGRFLANEVCAAFVTFV